MEDELTISREMMKVVSADTRTEILRSLDKRQMTASELSKFLNKHVTTVSEHLEILEKSNLIERIERPGKKWIYYKLTRLGKQILHPQPYKVILVLTLSFLALGVGAFMFPLQFGATEQMVAVQVPSKETMHPPSEPLPSSQQTSVNSDYSRLLVPVSLIGASIGGIVYSLKEVSKAYRRTPV